METLRVLVIDDELGMRLAVDRTLQGYSVQLPDVDGEVNFVVEMAGSGEEGLEAILANPPDVVLLDHKLPGISGLEVLNTLADRNLDLLVVMITAYASLETAIIATKRGAFDFLAKPFTPGELKAATLKAARHLILQRQARRLAEEKRQVRFQFLSVLAHELKAPLAAVQGYLYIMRDKSLGDEMGSYDKVIERSLLRIDGMRKMIMDLLDLTHIESGTKKRELGPVDLKEMAQLSMETMIPMALDHSITMNLDCPEPLLLNADRGEMEIVFNNLVSNAVKYNRDGGKVDVVIRAIPDGASVSVADTGIGMTAEESARLFKEFVRIKNSKTKNVLGSGLGLSIIKKLALVYGGDVELQSVADVGTTFTITLKNAQPETTVTTGNSAGEGGSPTQV